MSCAFNRILGVNLRTCRRLWGGHESKESHERGRHSRKNTEVERHLKSCGRFQRNFPDFTEARAISNRVVFHFTRHELVRCNLKVDPAFRPVRDELRPALWWCGTLRLRIFAWFMARFGMKTDKHLGHYKARLFSELPGTVLVIGSGPGATPH